MKTIELSRESIKRLIPELSHDKYKGQAGRIGTIGGSKEYTGAPFFSAMTALRLGADLSHVFCTESAGIPIKTYSPDLIVHPMLDQEDAVEQMNYWLPRLHSVVIGPGLGRNENVLQNVKKIIRLIQEQQKPVVIDGDGLFLITQDPSIITNYTHAILTPNVIEYKRLFEATMNREVEKDKRVENLALLSQKLGGVTIVEKGEVDLITNGEVVASVSEEGSPRRCGGQGDILAGSIGTFLNWAYQMSSCPSPPTIMAAFAGCTMTKSLNKITFNKFSIDQPGDTGRSMVTRDMIDNIGACVHHLCK